MKEKDRISLEDRFISALVSFIFSVPTVLLLWFGVNKNIAFLCFIGPSVMLYIIVGSAILGFFFPNLFSSVLGKVWSGIMSFQKWFQW